MSAYELGVCGWSLDRHDVIRSVELAAELGFGVVQLGFFGRDVIDHVDLAGIQDTLARCGVCAVGAFVAFDGEDYSSIARIAETGGFTPDDVYPSRLEQALRVAKFAGELGCASLAVHAVTVCREVGSPLWDKQVARVAEAADAAFEHGVRLLLETGREDAELLMRFVDAVDRDHVGVNFDPANLITFGCGDPVDAVETLATRIELVHMKDAGVSKDPGVSYGQRAVLGAGDARIPEVVAALAGIGYAGPLLIEANTRDGGLAVMEDAIAYLTSIGVSPRPA